MQDTKITKAVINERKELSINILVKEWDYTLQEHELLRIAKIEGNSRLGIVRTRQKRSRRWNKIT